MAQSNLRIHDPGLPLIPADLSKVEACLARPLPGAYRAFLLEHNGGKVTSDAIPSEGQGMGSLPLGYVWLFLGIEPERLERDLVWALKRIEHDVPSWLFPIAWTTMDDLVCIATAGHDAGAIYLLDFEEDDGESPARSGGWLRLASSLDAFLGSLYSTVE